ncbi:CapA family protein [Devosia nitrariae]|nr:CapA family protein [Devosia nitrariae]
MRDVTLMLAGDVMTGRGIDQILQHPSSPELYERYMRSALGYVKLAEDRNGAIRRAVPPSYVWGDALTALAQQAPDLIIINLETAITRSAAPEPKGINYRMHPDNIDCLSALRIDCCVLANNHVLDWGEVGLSDTLQALGTAGIRWVGAGRDAIEAAAPAVLPVHAGQRIVLHAFACPSSGVDRHWRAAAGRMGVNFVDEDDEEAIGLAIERVSAFGKADDIVVCSIHWGPNWGYDIDSRHRRFARALIDGGADLVFGHSSHHPKAAEIYRNRLVLYGCGDFLNDYESIGPHDGERSDLAVMYLPRLNGVDGKLLALRLVPFKIEKFRLKRLDAGTAAELHRRLQHEYGRFGLSLDIDAFGAMDLAL